MNPRPGEIYFAIHDKRRPIVVVSREELNRGGYVLAVPLTSSKLEIRRELSNCVFIEGRRIGLPKDCVAQLESVSLLAKEYLELEAGPLAALDPETMRAIIRALGYVIDAECEPT
ncbi:MAG: type II toxin-antitoxin system PemK/MazF family toxin [Planctomycetes bacterium]|nr:type II toxin-antitoxin system PemK/MazF family toxin [Planctomycetota bacterium]